MKRFFNLFIFFRNTLTLLFHNGMSNNDKDFEVCLRAENVILPKNGYFGISAATGGLADDHDVLKFNVFSLRSPEEAVKQAHDPEAEKFDQEFNQYQDKLKQQKEQWAKENPEEVYKIYSDVSGTQKPEWIWGRGWEEFTFYIKAIPRLRISKNFPHKGIFHSKT